MHFLTRPARLRGVAALAVVGCAGFTTRSAYAAPSGSFTFTVQPDGSGNVDVTGGGSFILLGNTTLGTNNDSNPSINPGADNILTGPTNSSYTTNSWNSPTGPSNFGSVVLSYANSGTGSNVYFVDAGTTVQVGLPASYVSGSTLTDSAIYNGKTLSDLGLTGGSSYQWSWAASTATDNFTINVVPEPSIIGLVSLPIGAALLRRRKRSEADDSPTGT